MRFSTLLTLAVSASPLTWCAPTPQDDASAPSEAERILAAAEAQAIAEAQEAGNPVEISKRTVSISACTVLEIAFPSRTYFPGSTGYDAENTSMLMKFIIDVGY